MIIIKLLKQTEYATILEASNNNNNYEIEVIDNNINLVTSKDGKNVNLEDFGNKESDLLDSLYFFILNTL